MKNLGKILNSIIINNEYLFCNTTNNGVEAVCDLDTVIDVIISDNCLTLVDEFETYNNINYNEETQEIWVEIVGMED